ncbi:MAG: hypothetical protein HY075_11380 [Deltaproteobacteria bacterium]|nr:hypothetical protein [Deltaproteobacteria bacterium]
MQTRLSEVDASGRGKPDVFRTYDADGRMVKSVYEDSPSRGITETLTIDEAKGQWTRRFTVGHTLIRQEIEQYGNSERLVSRESVWSSNKDGRLDRRLVETYPGPDTDTREFALEGGKWVEKRHDRKLTVYFGPAKSPGAQYADCLKDAGKVKGGSVTECGKFLDQLIDISKTDYTAYTNLKCDDPKGKQVFLPEGFRIDTDSCGSDPFVQAQLASAVKQLQADMKCIGGINPEVQKQLAKKVAERRPRINCLNGVQTAADSPLGKRLCDELAPHAVGSGGCLQKVQGLMDPKTGAFFHPATPNDVYLVMSDPKVQLKRIEQDARIEADHKIDKENIFNPAERDKVYDEILAKKKQSALAYPNESLAGTMFHEFLHLAGIPHNDKEVQCGPVKKPQHNCYLGGAYQQDAVYGCHSMCGGTNATSHWTKEGCLACVAWHNPTGDKSKCDKSLKTF